MPAQQRNETMSKNKRNKKSKGNGAFGKRNGFTPTPKRSLDQLPQQMVKAARELGLDDDDIKTRLNRVCGNVSDELIAHINSMTDAEFKNHADNAARQTGDYLKSLLK